MIATIQDFESLPPIVRASEAYQKIWRALEWYARATLLVHGSKAVGVVKGVTVDERSVVAAMVSCGTLSPIKVDLAGADPSVKVFTGVQYGRNTNRHVSSHEWTTDFALFWTYKPGNESPMPWDERPS